MTPTQRAAMQRALNFIRGIDADDNDRAFLNDSQCNELSVCEMFLSAALAEPAPVQEWMCVGGKLYNTAQKSRKAVKLTYGEVVDAISSTGYSAEAEKYHTVANVIQDAFIEKNGIEQ